MDNYAPIQNINIIDNKFIILCVACPFCQKIHCHGAGNNINHINKFVGNRTCHCSHSLSYRIVDDNRLIPNKIFSYMNRPVITNNFTY